MCVPSYVTAELKMSGFSEVVSDLFDILIFRNDALCVYSMTLVLEVRVSLEVMKILDIT
jgi:hypothetical protein